MISHPSSHSVMFVLDIRIFSFSSHLHWGFSGWWKVWNMQGRPQEFFGTTSSWRAGHLSGYFVANWFPWLILSLLWYGLGSRRLSEPRELLVSWRMCSVFDFLSPRSQQFSFFVNCPIYVQSSKSTLWVCVNADPLPFYSEEAWIKPSSSSLCADHAFGSLFASRTSWTTIMAYLVSLQTAAPINEVSHQGLGERHLSGLAAMRFHSSLSQRLERFYFFIQ